LTKTQKITNNSSKTPWKKEKRNEKRSPQGRLPKYKNAFSKPISG